jgi:tetratricopeptide (TPR) repeat protein
MMAEPGYDVFISYKAEDLALAEDLNARLVAEGFKVWFDRARLDPGCNWYEEIEAGCEASRIILPVLTPRWQASQWTKFETYGHECVIPLLFEGDFETAAPTPLKEFQVVDLREPTEEKWRGLLEAVRRDVSETPPEKAPRFVHVPYAHNRFFVGREELLLEIHEKLASVPTVALTHAPAFVLAGLGGVGKTTAAREYVEHFWRLYRQILWVQAGGGNLVGEFARLAVDLGVIPQPTDDAQRDAIRALRELEGGPQRVLILDNVEDEESVQEWIPKAGKCRTLITSRFAGWSPAVMTARVYVLEPEPARDLLLARAGLAPNDENRDAANQLAEELGYLPLALEQAAAYITRTRCTLQQYRELYAHHRRELLERGALGSTQYPASVATTWHTTVARLSPLAQDVLRLTAFLAPDSIPRELIAAAFAEESALAIGDVFGELADLSMISLDETVFSAHRLVQAIQRENMAEAEQAQWAALAVRVVDEALAEAPGDSQLSPASPEFWRVNRLLEPHAAACAGHISSMGMVSPEAARLLRNAGRYLVAHGRDGEAEPLYRQNTDILRQAVGAHHPDYATSLGNLGLLLHRLDRPDEAEPMLRQTLQIDEDAHGPDHSDVAIDLHNLAALFADTGRADEAERLWLRAIAIMTAALGAGHPTTMQMTTALREMRSKQVGTAAERRAAALDSQLRLGQGLRVKGHLGGALSEFGRLERMQQEDGDWAGVQNSIGLQSLILCDMGEFSRALEMDRRREQVCREHDCHEGLVCSLANQATLLAENLNRPTEALSLAEEAHRLAIEHGPNLLIEQTRSVLDRVQQQTA